MEESNTPPREEPETDTEQLMDLRGLQSPRYPEEFKEFISVETPRGLRISVGSNSNYLGNLYCVVQMLKKLFEEENQKKKSPSYL